MENSSKPFEKLQKTLRTVLNEIEKSETTDERLEKLCHVAGAIKPEVVATAIQMMETGKVRGLTVTNVTNTTKSSKTRRKFENFTEKPVFDKNDELMTWQRRQRKTGGKFRKFESPNFVEVESAKKREVLHFLYPSVHFCTCKYFQTAVFDRQTDWICTHLLAFYISKSFGQIETIECNQAIVNIIKKIFIRSVLVPSAIERK